MVRLEALLDSWKSIRRDTAQAWLDMPAEGAAFQPTPELMPYRDLAVHILNASHAMTMMLLAGESDFSAPGFRDRMRSHFLDASNLDSSGLASQLESVLEDDASRVRARGDETFFAEIMTRFDG